MALARQDEAGGEFLADVGFETRSERLAYLAGLVEGVQREEEPLTANLLAGIVEVLQEVSTDIGALRHEQRVLAEDMDELADELGVEPSDVVVECPSCGREVAFASGLLSEEDLELTCPNCGEVVYTPGEDELVDEPDATGGHEEPGVTGRQVGPADRHDVRQRREDRGDGVGTDRADRSDGRHEEGRSDNAGWAGPFRMQTPGDQSPDHGPMR